MLSGKSAGPRVQDLEASSIPVFILAGGRGTRLAGVADEPKSVVPVRGRPFLLYLLASLHQQGFRRMYLLAGYRSERLKEVLAQERATGQAEFLQNLEIGTIVEESPQGTGGALRPAARIVRGQALLLNGDSYCGVPYRDLLLWRAKTKAAVSMGLVRVDDAADYGQVQVDESTGRVTGFAEKAAEGSGWINAGVYALSHEFLDSIPARPSSLEKEILPAWVARGEVMAVRSEAYFRDIGTPRRLALAETEFPPKGLAGLV